MTRKRAYQKVDVEPADVHEAQKSFLVAVIVDAVLVAKGERQATRKEVIDCRAFLEGPRCQRWLSHLDIEPDCLNRIL